MKYNCDLIRDLLPLYLDGVCSEYSSLTVEEHLRECKACSGYLEQLHDSGAIEAVMETERRSALTSQARFFKRRSAMVGTVFAGVFMLPVLICLIIGMATGGLSWVMIVLAAMLIPASLVVVPLLAPENKALWTLGSFTVSLTLLLGVCCIISGGSWFFTAASASLFGLSVVFAPFAVRAEPIASRIGGRKAPAVMGLDTALYVLMMLCIGLSNGLGAGYYRLASAISLPIIAWGWALLLIIRYLKLGRLFKTAAALGMTGASMLLAGLISNINDYSSLVYIETGSRRYEFGTFTATAVIFLVIGAAFALAGALKRKIGRK